MTTTMTEDDTDNDDNGENDDDVSFVLLLPFLYVFLEEFTMMLNTLLSTHTQPLATRVKSFYGALNHNFATISFLSSSSPFTFSANVGTGTTGGGPVGGLG